MAQTTPTRNILALHCTSGPAQTPLQVHERRQAFLFRNQPNLGSSASSSSSISTIPATSSSSDPSIFEGLGNVRPPNKFMRFVHERMAPRWQRFEPRAVHFFRRQKQNIGRIGSR